MGTLRLQRWRRLKVPLYGILHWVRSWEVDLLCRISHSFSSSTPPSFPFFFFFFLFPFSFFTECMYVDVGGLGKTLRVGLGSGRYLPHPSSASCDFCLWLPSPFALVTRSVLILEV